MKKRLLLSIPLLSIMFLSSCQNILGGINLALSSNQNESDNNGSVESFDESLLDSTEEIIIPSERPSIDYSEELTATPSIPVEPSEPEQPSNPTIDNNQYYIDDTFSWHFAGNNEYFNGGKWIANEWNATDYNQLQPVNLDTIYKMDYNLAEQLSTKDIKYLYTADVRFGVNDAFWTSKAIINDELYEQNGSYCIKVVKSYFDENDGCFINDIWISDAYKAHLESLTPYTLFVPQWSEEKDKFGFCWYDNPVCIGEAGVYKLVIVEYNNEATPSTPNYGMGLVLDYYVESPFTHARYEEVETNSYGVIGSFTDNSWESDYVDFNYYYDDFYSVSFDINAGVEFRIRENDEWTISYGSDNVINKADLSGYFDFSCSNFLSNVNANITINLFANTGEIYIYVNNLNPQYVSYGEFANLALSGNDELVKVKGHITSIYKSGLYFADDNNDGFYAYYPNDFDVSYYSIGDEIEVTGYPTNYNGQYEFSKGCTVNIINKNPYYENYYKNINYAFDYDEETKNSILSNYVNTLVEINNVTIDRFDESSNYYYFSVNGTQMYIRGSSGFINPLTNDYFTNSDISSIFTNWDNSNKANVKGILSIYAGKYYINLINLDAVNYTNIDSSNYNVALDTKEYLFESFKDVYKITSELSMTTSMKMFDLNDNLVEVTINWEVQVSEGLNDVVYLGQQIDNQQYIIVKHDINNTINTYFSLIGTIQDSNGNVEVIQFDWLVPAYSFTSFSEFADLAINRSDEIANVKGKVIAIYKAGLYFEDENDDGFYAYYPSEFVFTDYKIGDEILVSGTALQYNGQYQFNKGCTVTKVNDAAEDFAPSYTDITEVFTNATSNADSIFDPYLNSLIEVKGATVDIADVSGGSHSLYYYFTLGNVRTYLRPYDGWINPDTGANYTMDEIATLFTEWNKGYTADLKGLLSIYGGKYYLSLVNNDAITYTSKELADDAKAAKAAESAANNFKETYLMEHTFNLPVVGQYDAILNYSISSDAAKIENGQLCITPLEFDTTANVKIIATVNGVVGAYTTSFVVKGTNYEAIDVDKAYELASSLDGSHAEISTEWYYVTATVGEIYNTQYCNFYLPTADNAQALTVYGLWTGEDSGENRYGSNREIAEIPVETGDTVTLYTRLQNYRGKLELVYAMLINIIPCEKLTWSGSTSGTFSLMNDGTYEAIIPLQVWNNVIFTYYDENGNTITLNHFNTTFTGLVRQQGEYGTDWSEKLYHDDVATELDGKFFCASSDGYTYFVSFDPNTMTLNVSNEKIESDVETSNSFVDTYTWTKETGSISEDLSTLTIDCEKYTITIYKNSASTNPTNIYDQIRFYKGSTLTIKAKDGYKILGVSFENIQKNDAILIETNSDSTNSLLSYTHQDYTHILTSPEPVNYISFIGDMQIRFTSIDVTMISEEENA